MWPFYSSEAHMVRGCGLALLNQELLSGLCWQFLCARFIYEELEGLWRTCESWLCKNTEGGLTAPFGRGGAQLTDIWLWFVYVCCQWSPPPGKSQGLQMCTCLCEVYKLK